jgi:hypothetical protein
MCRRCQNSCRNQTHRTQYNSQLWGHKAGAQFRTMTKTHEDLCFGLFRVEMPLPRLLLMPFTSDVRTSTNPLWRAPYRYSAMRDFLYTGPPKSQWHANIWLFDYRPLILSGKAPPRHCAPRPTRPPHKNENINFSLKSETLEAPQGPK